MEKEAKRLAQPHFYTLVVDLENARHRVMRNLIDGGSSINIIFTRALSQLNIPNKILRPIANPLRGFTKNEVIPLGQITLKATFMMALCSTTIDVNFIVVDSTLVYNTIIG